MQLSGDRQASGCLIVVFRGGLELPRRISAGGVDCRAGTGALSTSCLSP